jgi:hypothetical protein
MIVQGALLTEAFFLACEGKVLLWRAGFWGHLPASAHDNILSAMFLLTVLVQLGW